MSRKLDFLKHLAAIMLSDGKIDPQEQILFKNIARSMGIDKETIENLFFLDRLDVLQDRPLTEEEKVADIYALALMIKVDGEVNGKELETIHHIGLEMGLPSEALNNMLSLLFSRQDKVLSQKELKEIFDINKN